MKTLVKATFLDFNAGSKKDILKFEIKGDLTDAQIVSLHKLKGNIVFLDISSDQLDIYDYDSEPKVHEGIWYNVDTGGNVEVTEEQLTIENVPTPVEEFNKAKEAHDNEEKEPLEEMKQEESNVDSTNNENDDDLPF
ncbi:hypothetical protein EGH10_10710 [Brevibacillus laterosporus]|uniref:Uncharacterized protein n=1 Tax=Brevibacillus laterosporus LMG 15441 TaxID=1042163 RepID=A0A075QZV7_BRELA|nr:hypothetical protein [Brevibacillus laterosporus]AIG25144.1 hypothetical protein BRLA_c008010 [Brevibacillus laterosporus LMG 15441]RJL06588.1 hypothetical protein DM460_21860 [Brevibacillus laterosporus]TPH11771.1 hypothetical protein EGH10_10710 [Brevibacillus laterosporus]